MGIQAPSRADNLSLEFVLRAAPSVFFIVALFLPADISHAAESAARFKKVKSYSSERDYRRSLGKPFSVVEDGSLVFYDKSGKLAKRVPLKTEPDGHERRALFTQKGAIIVRTQNSLEAASAALDIRGPLGEALSSFDLPSPRFGVFPDGAAVLIPYGSGKSQYTDFNGKVSVVSSSGGILATLQIPTSGTYPEYAFSREGHVAAIVSRGRMKKGSSAIVFVDSTGREIGRHETSDWRPLAEDISSRLPYEAVPLARVDEVAKVAVVSGYERGSLLRFLHGINFSGNHTWRWQYDANWRDCGATLVLMPNRARVLVSEHCPDRIILTTLDILNGSVVQKASIPMSPGKTSRAWGTGSADGSQSVLNAIREMADGKSRLTSLLLTDALKVSWKEESLESASTELELGDEGELVIKQAGRVNVGRIEP